MIPPHGRQHRPATGPVVHRFEFAVATAAGRARRPPGNLTVTVGHAGRDTQAETRIKQAAPQG
jgi:hypothetical protein